MKTNLSLPVARAVWMQSCHLHQAASIQDLSKDLVGLVDRLGYVQIDTINVIERAHHHILWSRWNDYRPQHLSLLQSKDKSVFEYWTHALAYIPTKHFHHYKVAMKNFSKSPGRWYEMVRPEQVQKLKKQIQQNGALSISDIQDDVRVEKDHEWASRKPSKRVLQYMFNQGQLIISKREGMLKYYELTDRHFGWKKSPMASSTKDGLNYLIDRSLTSQGLVSLDSITHLKPSLKKEIYPLIEKRVANGQLLEVEVDTIKNQKFWMSSGLDLSKLILGEDLKNQIHLLSPFDPLLIIRKRHFHFFNYQHIFEAYIPIDKRKYGYFGIPVLWGDQVVSVIDFKTDRQIKKLKIQKWNWIKGHKSKSLKSKIEDKIHDFENFQLGR